MTPATNTMVGGEPSSAVDAGRVISAILIETEHTKMIYRLSQTRSGTETGTGVASGWRSVVAP